MLRTRLWMGAILVALVVAVLVADQAPWYPFLLLLLLVLSLAGCTELLHLLGPNRRPPAWLCYAGVVLMAAANWNGHLPGMAERGNADPWFWVGSAWGLVVVGAFVVEMTTFQEPGGSVARIALALWVVSYLGFLPSFFVQLRWLESGGSSRTEDAGTAALALAVFVPKCGDIGAYFTGRLLGRHRMTPVLSPKKTWEGAAGGLVTAVLAAVAIDRLGPAAVLQDNVWFEIGFGMTVGTAGMAGDLAESLIKRDCRQKDASQVVPGFGGVLDVVDSVLFAAPVAYWWLAACGLPKTC
jgi:phosphatidate cytidylyltransferase